MQRNEEIIVFKENQTAIENLSKCRETVWINPYKLPFELVDAIGQLTVNDDDIKDAEKRLLRFAPFIKKAFPETEEANGIIESPLKEITAMKSRMEEKGGKVYGRLFLKMDSHLAIAGSIKARGGIYEVLKHAEDLALENGLISINDNYEKFADMKEFFSQYTVQVGSTGNLGMSIGIMSAALGFKVKIHMSADAKEWKKALLRSKGVEVLEYSDDYSFAVSQGRKNSDKDPYSYFVDDEKSTDLFLGYAVAANRLKAQMEKMNIVIDENHPLVVHIPAGVGGAPGGICYGLKRVFGDNVHCFFAEPVLCPSVTLGIATQKHEKANVRDYGISGKTEADGLACASPSGFVTRIMTNHVSGSFTVQDDILYTYMKDLYETENVKIEPSSCAAFRGAEKLSDITEYFEKQGITENVLSTSVQIAWATGGRLVPEDIFNEYLTK